jgi:hypothetical protein
MGDRFLIPSLFHFIIDDCIEKVIPISMTWQMPVPLCTLPTLGINELTILAPILLTAYIDIYCGRNQKPVPPILGVPFERCKPIIRFLRILGFQDFIGARHRISPESLNP